MNQKPKITCYTSPTDEKDWRALRDVLVNDNLTKRVRVAAFEAAFAKKHGVKYAIATNNSTSALHIILVAMGIEAGDEVIIPALAWVGVANVVLYCGATPVLVDVDPNTYNLDIQGIANQVNKRTKAIIVTHNFGLCADIQGITSVAPSIPIIEDASAAIGSKYGRKLAGSLGKVAAFSLHPQQVISTGEGGMITTNDQDLAEKLIILRNHGSTTSAVTKELGKKPYSVPIFSFLGFHYNMNEIQGAIGLTQLFKLENLLAAKRIGAEFYTKELASIPWLKTPSVPENYTHTWQKYVCYVDEEISPMSRNNTMEYLASRGIETRISSLAIHLLSYYQIRFGFEANDYPIAKKCANCTFVLPLHHRLSKEDFNYIVETIKSI